MTSADDVVIICVLFIIRSCVHHPQGDGLQLLECFLYFSVPILLKTSVLCLLLFAPTMFFSFSVVLEVLPAAAVSWPTFLEPAALACAYLSTAHGT